MPLDELSALLKMRPSKKPDYVDQQVVMQAICDKVNKLMHGEYCVILLRGPPGTGKLTLAKTIAGKLSRNTSSILSVDEYFTKTGENGETTFEFDVKKLPYFHNQNNNRINDILSGRLRKVIFVHGVYPEPRHIETIRSIAQNHNARFMVVEIVCMNVVDAFKCGQRSERCVNAGAAAQIHSQMTSLSNTNIVTMKTNPMGL